VVSKRKQIKELRKRIAILELLVADIQKNCDDIWMHRYELTHPYSAPVPESF